MKQTSKARKCEIVQSEFGNISNITHKSVDSDHYWYDHYIAFLPIGILYSNLQVKTNYYKLFWIILSHKQRSEWSCIWPNTLTNQTASFGEEEKHQLHFILFLVYSCWQQEQHIRDKLQPKGGSEGNLCYRLSLWLDRNVCVYVGVCVCVYTCVCACVCSRCE